MKQLLEWQIATVKALKQETARVKSITLSLPNWVPHRPGQHYDIRLTAPDGYQAQRSYSIASESTRVGEIDLTVEKIDDGEVSPYLHEVLVLGDQVEVRGPIGGYFVWEPALGGPLLLIAGGSGVVPLMSMLRARATSGSQAPVRLLYSSRTPEDIIYAGELEQLSKKKDGIDIINTFTRSQPPGWKGYARRIDVQMLKEIAKPYEPKLVMICGPTPLVESAANGLVEIGVPANRIKTERFGPSGK